MTCPFCEKSDKQVKAGIYNGEQRFKCQYCRRRYIINRTLNRYPDDLRLKAKQLHDNGTNFTEIGRILGVNYRSVASWINKLKKETPVEQTLKSMDKKQGKKRASIYDVAKTAGVSISTVSNFLNNKGRMSATTRQSIEKAVETLNFQPSSLIQAIHNRRTRILGLRVDSQVIDTAGSIIHPVLKGAVLGARKTGEQILIFDEENENIKKLTLNGYIDGLIWVIPGYDNPIINAITKTGLPFICLLSRHKSNATGYVTIDNIDGIDQIVQHLYSIGHRRMAYLGVLHNTDFEERYKGYKIALTKLDISIDTELIGVSYNYNLEIGNILNRWVNMDKPPTAIICANDDIAFEVMDYLKECNIAIPDHFAITGFDNVTQSETYCGGLTTIAQPFSEMAALAAEKLVSLVNGAPIKECQITFPGKLVVRRSTVGDRDIFRP